MRTAKMRSCPGLVAHPERYIIHRNEGLIHVMRLRLNGGTNVPAAIAASATGAAYVVIDDDQQVTTTAEHPFMVVGQGWTPVRELRKGDPLVRPDGSTVTIHSVDATGDTATVQNFAVEGLHNYYVQAGDEWLFAHNSCGLPTLHVTQGTKLHKHSNQPSQGHH